MEVTRPKNPTWRSHPYAGELLAVPRTVGEDMGRRTTKQGPMSAMASSRLDPGLVCVVRSIDVCHEPEELGERGKDVAAERLVWQASHGPSTLNWFPPRP